MLREILARRLPAMLGRVDSLGARPLAEEEREAMRGSLAEGLCESGLDEDDEHNARGRRIETLIDLLADC